MKKTFVLLLILLLSRVSWGEYSIERTSPLEKNLKINSNFGEFRNKTGTYKAHDGLDFKTTEKHTSSFKEVYPVAPGTARIYPGNTDGWGKYVIVEHPGGFQTRYAHLDSISVEANAWVTTGTVIGVSGATQGGKIPGMKPHLHFSLGTTSVLPADTVNPIFAGLKRTEYGDLSYAADPSSERLIRLLATGSDGTFDGENEIIDVPEPNKPVRAVVEAYLTENKLGSNPYRVEFEVEKLNDLFWPKQMKEIVFDTMTNILNNFEEYYCFAKPYVTKQYTDPGYYFIKFYPTAGRYKITAKIFACYRDDYGFHLTTPNMADGTLIERYITVGLNMVDFIDSSYSYAWLPDDIANRGTMLASVPTHTAASSVRASAAAPLAPPEIFYAYANNNMITSNLIDIDPNLQQKALIEARSTPAANWLVQIKNASGAVVDSIPVPNQSWLRTEWGAGKPAGIYTFTVTALNAAGVTTYESYDKITIDNNRPSAIAYTINNSVSTAEQTISTLIRPNKNLRSVMVNVVKDRDFSIVEEMIYTTPFAEKDKDKKIDWEDAIAYPDGFYRLQYVMTDVAGNIAKAYSPVVSVNKSGSYFAPAVTVEVSEPALPELPKWEERPRVSAIAIDGLGNKYVLYGRYDKLVKYDPSGTVITSAEGFRCPLGLAVSPAGDRVYVADTFANRVMIYDTNLSLINIIKGRDVFMERNIEEYDTNFLGFYTGHIKNVTDLEIINEGYWLPKGITLDSGYLYVVDSGKHRVLKYTKDGLESLFDILVAHHSDCRHYTNALNETYYGGHAGRTDYNAYNNSDLYRYINFTIHNINFDGYGATNGQFHSPEAVAISPFGAICAADTQNNRIQKFNPDGSFAAKFGETILKSPKGIDIDSYGNVWVADTGNRRIVEFDSSGNYVGEYKSEDYEINPQKIKVKDGKIYIADADSDKPLIWSIGGTLINTHASNSWFSTSNGSAEPLNIYYTLSQPADVTIQLIPKSSAGVSALSTSGVTILNKAARGVGVTEESWSGGKANSGQMSLDKAREYFDLSISQKDGTYVITGIPKKENKFLGKMEFYVDGDRWVPTKIFMYDAKGKLMSQSVIEYQQVAGLYVPARNMSNISTPMGKMAVEMVFENIKVNEGIGDGEFEVEE